MRALKDIEKEALGLSFEDRARLADVLLFSLDKTSLEKIEQAWTSEAILRDEEIAVGIELKKH